MHEKNCEDGMSFLVMAKEMGLPAAIFWARRLGLKYKRPLALLTQLNVQVLRLSKRGRSGQEPRSQATAKRLSTKDVC